MLERTIDRAQAIKRVLHLAERYGHETHSAGQASRHPSGNVGISVLSHIQGVGSKTAKALLENLGGQLVQIANAGVERLQTIDGVGPKTASRIRDFWRKDWR